jgi:hypothetical protein
MKRRLFPFRPVALCLYTPALCGVAAFLLSPLAVPPKTTYAALLGIHACWRARPIFSRPPPPPRAMPPRVQAALRAVLEDPEFLADVRAGKNSPGDVRAACLKRLRRAFPGGDSDPPPRDWIGSRVSLEFDTGDAELCYLVTRSRDAREAEFGARCAAGEFCPHAEKAVKPLADPDPDADFRRRMEFPERPTICLDGRIVWRNETDDRLPDRLRLALSAAALAAAAVVGAAVAGEAIRRRRRQRAAAQAAAAIPESLLSHPRPHDDPAPAAPAVATDGIQDFPPPPRPTAP